MDETTTTEMSSAAAAAWSRVAIADAFEIDSLSDMEFAARVLRGGIAHIASRRWPTTATSLEAVLPHAVMTVRYRACESAHNEAGQMKWRNAACIGDATSARVGSRAWNISRFGHV